MAQTGYGCAIRVSDAGSTIALTSSPTTLGEIMNPVPPNPTRDIIDVTHAASTGQAREFIVGLIDYGECTFDLNWTPGNATDTLLRSISVEDETREYEITFPVVGGNDQTVTFAAYLTAYERSAPVDGKMTGTVTLKVTGEPTWASVSA